MRPPMWLFADTIKIFIGGELCSKSVRIHRSVPFAR
jgi:hypothetical protein